MNDRGSIVLGWLGKLVIVFAVLGVLAFDGFTVVTSSFSAADDATTAANAAAVSYQGSHNVQQAYDAAVASLDGKPDTIPTSSFSVAPNGFVTLSVQRTPHTLWMHYLAPLRHWTRIDQSATGSPGS